MKEVIVTSDAFDLIGYNCCEIEVCASSETSVFVMERYNWRKTMKRYNLKYNDFLANK